MTVRKIAFIALLLSLLLSVLSFTGGIYYNRQHVEPIVKYIKTTTYQIVEVPSKPIDRIVKETVYNTIEVPVIKEVTVIQEALVSPKDFVSIEQAQGWLDKNHLSIVIKGDTNGVISFVPNNQYNCNDYAQELQNRALKEGYLLNYQIVKNGYILDKYVTNAPNNHIGLLARIKDEYYYIESTPGLSNSFKLVYISYAERN